MTGQTARVRQSVGTIILCRFSSLDCHPFPLKTSKHKYKQQYEHKHQHEHKVCVSEPYKGRRSPQLFEPGLPRTFDPITKQFLRGSSSYFFSSSSLIPTKHLVVYINLHIHEVSKTAGLARQPQGQDRECEKRMPELGPDTFNPPSPYTGAPAPRAQPRPQPLHRRARAPRPQPRHRMFFRTPPSESRRFSKLGSPYLLFASTFHFEGQAQPLRWL